MQDMEVERQSIGVLWEENDFPAARNSTFNPCVFRRRSCSDTDSDSDSDFESTSSDIETTVVMKKRKVDSALPPGFLDPLPPELRRAKKMKTTAAVDEEPSATLSHTPVSVVPERSCRQFWKAGDYEEDSVVGDSSTQLPGGGGGGGRMDHLRVHPRFLHSNATSHKWALGAMAELLDNSLDEVRNGATFVNVDVISNRKDNNSSKMLVVEDNGGGMTPDKLRQCMSLGYSVKSKLANTIGQYGNGFKTSTMRLGADVIVFSQCYEDGIRLTKSIGMLSYTFLTRTRKEDIVVPMIDYELKGLGWKKLIRSSLSDWSRNLETILRWSPYASEEELFGQFSTFRGGGTRIVIYNLWEDDEGKLELDFDTDETDIQIRGVNQEDEKKIEMAKEYPHSRHFLTYQHSLRSYASILYLRMPPEFRMILRGKDIEHHNLVDDMMLSKEITYRPMAVAADGTERRNDNPKKMVAAVGTVGFVKDVARSHIDIQGFNVYHKNRLIKPFWRVWNAAGSDGRGVIGVLEADFVEPAHDKQGFERTTALARLEARLVAFQKSYWSTNCQEIGYAPRRKGIPPNSSAAAADGETTPPSSAQPDIVLPPTPTNSTKAHTTCRNDGTSAKRTSQNDATPPIPIPLCAVEIKKECIPNDDHDRHGFHHASECSSRKVADGSNSDNASLRSTLSRRVDDTAKLSNPNVVGVMNANADESKERMSNVPTTCRVEEGMDRVTVVRNLLCSLKAERDKCKLLACRLVEVEEKIKEMDKEQETLIDNFSEERTRRDAEGERLKNSFKKATSTIWALLDKVKLLETKTASSCSVSEPVVSTQLG